MNTFFHNLVNLSKAVGLVFDPSGFSLLLLIVAKALWGVWQAGFWYRNRWDRWAISSFRESGYWGSGQWSGDIILRSCAAGNMWIFQILLVRLFYHGGLRDLFRMHYG